MAIHVRLPKRVKKIRNYVKYQYPTMNGKIVSETVAQGHLNYKEVKDMLDAYLKFGDHVLEKGEVYRIPYIGKLTPKPWLLKYYKEKENNTQNADTNTK